jgi:hypothetical protein
VQVAGGDVAGGGGDGAQRSQEPAGDQPAEHQREHDHDGKAQRGGGEQPVELLVGAQ